MSAAAALQAAIHVRLSNDAALTGLIGPGRVHDRVPAEEAFPYISFGASGCEDWSSGTEAGEQHFVRIHAWSRQPGRKEALALADATAAAIESAGLALAGHRLVLLRRIGLEAAYDPALRGFRATLTFEALTEAQ
jgi:hypothetical protein